MFKNHDRFFYELVWCFGFQGNLNKNLLKGYYGEWLAKKHLKKLGYKHFAQNWRSKFNPNLEIDIVSKDLETFVFVEVRARSKNSLINGFESINFKKRKTLLRAFKAFLRENRIYEDIYRFDIVEIDLPASKADKPRLFHHENIAIF